MGVNRITDCRGGGFEEDGDRTYTLVKVQMVVSDLVGLERGLDKLSGH